MVVVGLVWPIVPIPVYVIRQANVSNVFQSVLRLAVLPVISMVAEGAVLPVVPMVHVMGLNVLVGVLARQIVLPRVPYAAVMAAEDLVAVVFLGKNVIQGHAAHPIVPDCNAVPTVVEVLVAAAHAMRGNVIAQEVSCAVVPK
jgi:hypothetical protein